ncbi:MAG: hypothetical protein AB1791_01360 [Chloroflexota bacterium]
MKQLAPALLALLIASLLFAGCGSNQPTPAGDPHIELISLAPDPPKVGLLDVVVRVLGPDGRPMDEQIERVRIVPEMVGMPSHTVENLFTSQGNGLYSGQADVSALGGPWQLKVIVELKDKRAIEQAFEIVVQY